MYDIEYLTSVVRKRMGDYRFHHSVCVSQCAKKLAKRYGADEEKAEVAGILHDATKETPPLEQLELIKRAGFEITDFEKSQLKFYHQISGAAFAKVELGIEDEEILNAIRYHTTGKADMSLMEQIIYLADFISDDRDYKDIDNIRAEADISKERGMLYATGYTIKHNVKKYNLLHPQTVEAYNWILETFFIKEKGN